MCQNLKFEWLRDDEEWICCWCWELDSCWVKCYGRLSCDVVRCYDSFISASKLSTRTTIIFQCSHEYGSLFSSSVMLEGDDSIISTLVIAHDQRGRCRRKAPLCNINPGWFRPANLRDWLPTTTPRHFDTTVVAAVTLVVSRPVNTTTHRPSPRLESAVLNHIHRELVSTPTSSNIFKLLSLRCTDAFDCCHSTFLLRQPMDRSVALSGRSRRGSHLLL